MRYGSLAVVASAVAHVGLMAVLASIDPPPPPKRPPPATVVTLVDPPPRPIDVALVTLPPPAATAPPAAPTAPPRADRAAAGAPRDRIATAPAAPTGPTAPGTTGELPAAGGEPGPRTDGGGAGGHGIFDMRPGPRVDLSPRAVAERAHIDGGAPPPPPVRPSGELKPSGNGTFRSPQPGFTAEVDRNGDVHWKDAPAFSFHLPILDVAPRLPGIIARRAERWANDPWEQVRLARRDPSKPEAVALPGPERPEDEDIEEVIVPIIGGSAELTDYVMRRGGIDPYAAAKRAFLERTRDERMAMKQADLERQLRAAGATARQHAAHAWTRADLDAPARRAALFELWDDAAEDGPPELVAAGAAARNAVLGYIRTYLPAGSADAFTPAELTALNARRTSTQRFEPY